MEPSASETKNGRLPNGECASTKTPRSLIDVALIANGSLSGAPEFAGRASFAIQRAIVASISTLSSFTELKLSTIPFRSIFFATTNCGELLKLGRPDMSRSIVSTVLFPESQIIADDHRRATTFLTRPDVSRFFYFSRVIFAPRAVKTRSISVVMYASFR